MTSLTAAPEQLMEVQSPFWTRDLLPSPFRTVFTTRHCGLSSGAYDSLNLALHVGDDPRRVRENRRLALESFKLDNARAIVAQQVHHSAAFVVGEDDAGAGSFSHADSINGADALVTRSRTLPLICLSADCMLLALGDPETGVLGLLHAGWRGMADGVIENTLERMCEMGAKPGRIHAASGPSIGPCCFEVGAEVVSAIGESHVTNRIDSKAWINLRSAARQRLESRGIVPESIKLDEACTCCRSDLFFSHRRTTRENKKQQTGRMAMVAWIA